MRRHAVIRKRVQTQSATKIITLYQLFNEWHPNHSKGLSNSAKMSYTNALRHIHPILHISIHTVRFSDLQGIIDAMHAKGLSYSSCKKVRTLLNQLFNYAIVNDYINKNYAPHLNLGTNTPTIKRRIFTRQQINKLWRMDHTTAHMILILLYTGLRIGELLNLRRQDINRKSLFLIVAKSKTAAGQGRLTPIHRRIWPLIEMAYNTTDDYLFNISYSSFRKKFTKLMKALNCKHTIHDTRHSFASMLDTASAPPNTVRALMGHKNGDITMRVYTHKTIRELRRAIEMLK